MLRLIRERRDAVVVGNFLKSERDFNKALDLVVTFLSGVESWRVKCYGKDVLSISEILILYGYHRRFWSGR